MVNSLATVGSCVVAPDYIYSSSNSPCSVQSTVLSTQIPVWNNPATVSVNQTVLTCLTCNNYMFRYQPNQAEAICVNTTQLVLNRNYVAVANCVRYGVSYSTTAQVVCMQCASGYFLSGWSALRHLSTSTSCVSSCALAASNSPAIVVDDLFGFVNICAPFVASGNTPTTRFEPDGICARYGRVFFGDISGTDGNDVRKSNFACLATTSQTGNLPTNFMNYWFVSALAGTTPANYYYDGPSNTAQLSSVQLVLLSVCLIQTLWTNRLWFPLSSTTLVYCKEISSFLHILNPTIQDWQATRQSQAATASL